MSAARAPCSPRCSPSRRAVPPRRAGCAPFSAPTRRSWCTLRASCRGPRTRCGAPCGTSPAGSGKSAWTPADRLVTEFVLPAGLLDPPGPLPEPPLDVPSGLAPADPDFHQCDEPLPVEVEQDDAWWHGSLYARPSSRANGECGLITTPRGRTTGTTSPTAAFAAWRRRRGRACRYASIE